MKLFAQIVGLLAVAALLLSYQQKKRRGIVFLNVISRVLYIVQYIMLGAFEGAALDVLGTVSSVAAQNKDKKLIKKYIRVVFILINVVIIGVGLILYEDIFSLFPIFGVLFQTVALWLDDEKLIRRLSLLGTPFWLVYNLSSAAYGSVIGDVLTICSILIAIYRYDIKGVEKP